VLCHVRRGYPYIPGRETSQLPERDGREREGDRRRSGEVGFVVGGRDISPPDNSPGQFPSQLGQFPPYRSKPNFKIIYIYIHVYTHAYIYTYMHIYIDSCTHVYTHTIHTCIHTYIYTYIQSYIYTYIQSYILTYFGILIHICIHTYIHVYSHTYIQMNMYVCL